MKFPSGSSCAETIELLSYWKDEEILATIAKERWSHSRKVIESYQIERGS